MPRSVPKTLSDDFLERIRNTFRKEFIENVDTPTRLVDYLQCLETIDEQKVIAQQIQYGAMHAASVLFDCLIRRPDWLEDLKRALRETGVGLGFLADKLENFEQGYNQTENQSQPLEESDNVKHNGSKRSNMVTPVKECGFSTKTQNVETDVDKECAASKDFTSTNFDTNDEMNFASSSLTHASSLGYPLKKCQDDTLSQSMVDRLSGQMKSVGILIAPKRVVGTVFRVGSRYLMTALHVVKDLADPDSLIRDNSVYVTFHESVLDLDRQAYRLTKVVFWSPVLDVAVLELANSDSALPPKMQLSKDDITTLNVKEVSFIGYGHPDQSNIKHLDPRCKLISPQSQRFVEAQNWLDNNVQYIKRVLNETGHDPEIVNKGYAGYTDNHKLLFDCFIQQGASGSPALTYNNFGQVKVVGILTHGLPEFFFLLPQELQHHVDKRYRFEVGSRMSSIYNCILDTDKDLAKDLFE